MANEYSIVATVDASGSLAGAREFKRSLAEISRTATKIVAEADRIRGGFRQLGASADKTGSTIAADFRKTAQSVANSSTRMVTEATKASAGLKQFASSAASSSQQLVREYQRLPRSAASSARSVVAENARMSASFGLLGSTVTRVRGLVAGFAAGFTATAAVGWIAGFEKSMARLRGLLGQEGALGDMAKLEQSARTLGATTIFSAGEAAQGLTELVKAGMSADQAITAARATLNLAAAEQMELGQASKITAVTLAQFGLGADQAGRVTDVLAKASVSAQTDVAMLAQGMKYAGGLAKQLGMSVEETAAALAVLSDAGMSGEQAGTNFSAMLRELAEGSKRTRTALGEMNTDLGEVQRALASENGLSKAIALLKPKFEAVADPVQRVGLATRIFGTEGARAALALMGLNDRLDKYTVSLNAAGGTTQAMADSMNDTLSGSWQELMSAVEELMLQLGDSGLKGVLRGMADGIGGFARGLGGLSEDMTKSTERMREWNSVGQFLRDNIETITDAAVVLATVYVSRMIPGMLAYIATLNTGIVSTIRYQMALASMAGASRVAGAAVGVATVAARGLSAAMGVLGGPLGIVLLAATALMTFSGEAKATANESAGLKAEVDQLGQGFQQMGEKAKIAAFHMASATGRKVADRAREVSKLLADDQAAQKRLSQGVLRGGWSDPGYDAGTYMRAKKMVLSASERASLKAEAYQLEEAARKMEGSVRLMRDGVMGLKAEAETASPAVGTLALNLGDADEKGAAAAARKAEQAMEKLRTSAASLMNELNPLAGATLEYNDKLQTLKDLQLLSESELKKFGLTALDVDVAMQKLNATYAEQKLALDPISVKYKDLREDMARVAKQARPLETAQQEYNKKLAETTALLNQNDEAITRAGTSRAALIQYQRDLGTEMADTAAQIAKNSKQADPWAKAWESAIERLDGLFVDLWKSAFDGFDGFKDKIVDTFKSMLAELANAAFTRSITGWMSKFLGEPGAGNSGGAAGLIQAGVGIVTRGSMGGGFMGVSNGAGGTVSSAQTGVFAGSGGGSGGTSYSQIGSLMAKGFVKYSSQIAGGASAAAPYVAGAAGLYGAYYGYKNAGSGGASSVAAGVSYGALGYAGATVGMGALAGAAGATAGAGIGAAGAGAATGAMGAAAAIPVIGWILAAMALIDLVSGGKLFGTKFAAESGTTSLGIGGGGGDATQTLYETRQKALFGGKKRRTREIAASAEAEKAADELYKSIANVMKEAAKTLNVEVPSVITGSIATIAKYNKKGKVTGTSMQVTAGGVTRDVKDAEEAGRWLSMEAVYAVIESAFPKADAIRAMWGDSLEALEQGVQSFMGLLAAINSDPLKDAEKAFADAQKSGLQRYREQKAEYSKLLETFDGSLTSIGELTTATQNLKKVQYDLIMAYKDLSEYGKTMFGGTRQNIRESLMDPEQLYALRQTQIGELMGQMRGETDPAKLQALADEINRLSTDAYNMLDEDQRKQMAGGFLSFLDEAEALLLNRAQLGLDELSADSGAVREEAMTKLNEAADRQLAASTTFDNAVNRFATAVAGMGGGSTGSRLTTAIELMTL